MDDAAQVRSPYIFGRFRLDPARRALTHADLPVTLTPVVFETLLCLVENAGRLVTKDELMAAVWPGRIVEEFNLTQAISTLRRVLNGVAPEARLIVTAPGRGYRFTADVQREAPTYAPIDNPADAATAGKPRSRRDRGPPVASIAAICLVLLAAATAVIFFRKPATYPTPTPSRILVLDTFQNFTGEPIFDLTLRKTLEIDLDQSPLLSVLSERRVQETLALMTRSADERLTPALAQEVCARNNGAGVLEGSIAPIGGKYLLTLTATDCDGARMLAARKGLADNRDAVVGMLDRLTAELRSQLGESVASIRQYDTPMQPEKTVSLAALKSYSEGVYLLDHGREADSIALFEHAVELDPNFAGAYESLSRAYSRFNEDGPARVNSARAYALRDTVSEPERFAIVSRYHQLVTGDLAALIAEARLWSESYPRDPTPWLILASAYRRLGEYNAEADAARHSLALGSVTQEAYLQLGLAHWQSGNIDAALADCAEAAARGVAGEDIHLLLLRIALGRHDQAGIAREMAWVEGKPAERHALLILGAYDFGQGQVRAAMDILAREEAFTHALGLRDVMATAWVEGLADVGMTRQAGELLGRIRADTDSNDYTYVLAKVGDAARARRLLETAILNRPRDTLLVEATAPVVRSALAMRAGRPRDAIAALLTARPHGNDAIMLPYMLGQAYLASNDGAAAARAFETALGNSAEHPIDSLLPLARLGLARAERMEGDFADSRRDYQTFLALWKNADPDTPVLKAAKTELAGL